MKPLPAFQHYDTLGRRRDFGDLSRSEAAAILRQWRMDPLGIPRIERTPTHRQYALQAAGGSLLVICTFPRPTTH